MKKIFLFLLLMIITSCSSINSRIDYQPLEVFVPMTVYVVPNKSYFPKGCKQWNNNGGCASGMNIWVIGKLEDGGIYISEKILGHEVRHLLNNKSFIFKNPDARRF